MAKDWSRMPLDLLAVILMKLKTCEDFIYFSLVCWWWNRVASLVKNDWRGVPTPWLLLAENNKENPKYLRKIFNLKDNKCYESNLPETFERRCWGSAYGWVAMIDGCLNVELFNPITKAHIPFPSLENIPSLDGSAPICRQTRNEYISWCLQFFLRKMVVLQVPQNCPQEFVIVAFCVSKCVALARPGDQSWTFIPIDKEDYEMDDVVVMDDHVFALFRDGRLVCWDAKKFFNLEFGKQMDYSPRQPHIFGEEEEHEVDYLLNKTYLVQSSSELIMVIRYAEEVIDEKTEEIDCDIVYKTYFFNVFKLNSNSKVWEEIEELCDVALLVGCNSSMFVPAGKYLRENCIYFTDDEHGFWNVPKEFGGHDMGFFDIGEGEIGRFYEGDDMRSLFCPPTFFIPCL